MLDKPRKAGKRKLPALDRLRYAGRHLSPPHTPLSGCRAGGIGSCLGRHAGDTHFLPLFHRLLTAFERRTGVPVLLNTSFNIKGEPIVCRATDALRTFWATGLEALAIGKYLIRKPNLR